MIDASTLRYVRGSILIIDVDNHFAISFRNLAGRIRVLRNSLHFLNFCYAKTKRGWHIHIETRERLNPPEIIAIQAILGSDRNRECLNMYRWLCMRDRYNGLPRYWKKRWNLSFERKLK